VWCEKIASWGIIHLTYVQTLSVQHLAKAENIGSEQIRKKLETSKKWKGKIGKQNYKVERICVACTWNCCFIILALAADWLMLITLINYGY